MSDQPADCLTIGERHRPPKGPVLVMLCNPSIWPCEVCGRSFQTFDAGHQRTWPPDRTLEALSPPTEGPE